MACLQVKKVGFWLVLIVATVFFIMASVQYIPERVIIQWIKVPKNHDDVHVETLQRQQSETGGSGIQEGTRETTDEHFLELTEREGAQFLDTSTDENFPGRGKVGEYTDKKFQEKERGEKVPDALRHLISDTAELKGRHSYYIMPECDASTNPQYAWKTNRSFDFEGPFKYLDDYKNPCWLDDNEELRCVPYFYQIGAPKAGSTDLFKRLSSHPHILRGTRKEVRWWDKKRFEVKSFQKFESYVNFFDVATQEVKNYTRELKNGTIYHYKVIGDGSPTYYYSSTHWRLMPGNEGCGEPRVTAMSHIHRLWPLAKILLLLRNPVTRLYSTYLYNWIRTGADRTPQQFHEWVLQSMNVWYECLGNHTFRYCMYDHNVVRNVSKITTFAAGMYSRYILDLLKIFPMKQILVINLEDYSKNMEGWLAKIFKFLALPPLEDSLLKLIVHSKAENRGWYTEQMLPATRKMLEEFYGTYNRELAAILDDDRFL